MKTIFYIGAFISICSAGFSLFVGILTLTSEHYKKFFFVIVSIFLGSIVVTIATYQKENIVNQEKINDEADKNERHSLATSPQKSGDSNSDRSTQRQHDSVNNYVQTLTVIKRNNMYGFVNNKNEEVIRCQYDNVFYLPIGLIMVTKDKKIGFICRNGDTISCQYDLISPFSENGLAAVKKLDRWGYIDKTGKEVIACQYLSSEEGTQRISNLNYGKEISLTEDDIKRIKIQCREIVIKYYSSLSILGFGGHPKANIDNQDKELGTNFFSKSSHSRNNGSNLGQKTYSVNDYLRDITTLSDRIGAIDYNTITLSGVYYDNKNGYYLIATVEQKYSTGDQKFYNKKKMLDFYLTFDAKTSPKIFAIQNHKDGVLSMLTPIIPNF